MIEPRQSAVVLACAVVAAETPGDEGSTARGGGAEGAVMTKLRGNLGKLIGPNGFDVLVARALTVAKKAEPALSTVTVDPRGALDGFAEKPADRKRSLIAVLSHLLELLMRFIGEDLAVHVIRGIWSNVTDAEGSTETKQ
jgi:hypothetical protein